MNTLTKQEWITIVQWLQLRFTALKWNDRDIRSLYEDFKEFDGELVWEACNLLYDNRTEFMNANKLKSLCKELSMAQAQGGKALPMGNVMDINKGGLLDFLKANGYESFAHAVWDATVKRHKSGKALVYEPKINTDEPWEVAKDSFLQTFSPEWRVDDMENRRENGDK